MLHRVDPLPSSISPGAELALDRAFPGIDRHLPRIALTCLPTPVQPLVRLAQARNIGPLWVKRDDQSGRLYGGNKPRKLEFLLGDARRRGRRSVMTFGGIGTHHGLATAICAREAGFRCLLVLIPQPVTEHVQRCLLLDHAYGAELHSASGVPGVVAVGLWLLARGIARGEVPAIIPTGGTSALGALGYVNAALELAEQVRGGELPEPEHIFVPLGSGGTVAGLVLGLKLARLRSRVVSVLVTDILPPSRKRLARLARAMLARLRRALPAIPSLSLTEGDFLIDAAHLGRGYGAPTAEGREAQQLLRELEGIELETTYSAKCLAALLALAATPPYRAAPLLFWNTYSSVDPGSNLASLPAYSELPPAFHRFFKH